MPLYARERAQRAISEFAAGNPPQALVFFRNLQKKENRYGISACSHGNGLPVGFQQEYGPYTVRRNAR